MRNFNFSLAQFVIISLRNNMFELADRLVGIYKTNNTTKSVTINPKVFGVELSTGVRLGAAASATKAKPLIDSTNQAPHHFRRSRTNTSRRSQLE